MTSLIPGKPPELHNIPPVLDGAGTEDLVATQGRRHTSLLQHYPPPSVLSVGQWVQGEATFAGRVGQIVSVIPEYIERDGKAVTGQLRLFPGSDNEPSPSALSRLRGRDDVEGVSHPVSYRIQRFSVPMSPDELVGNYMAEVLDDWIAPWWMVTAAPMHRLFARKYQGVAYRLVQPVENHRWVVEFVNGFSTVLDAEYIDPPPPARKVRRSRHNKRIAHG